MNHQYNPTIHHRRSIRLQGYNYAQAGAYFVTICSQQKAHLFGEIIEGKMVLNEYGHIIHQIWHELPQHYANISLAEFVIMPNHIHGILVIHEDIIGFNELGLDELGLDESSPYGRNSLRPNSLRPNAAAPDLSPPKISLGEIIRGFKARCSRRINQLNSAHSISLWHRNYYEHIIRNDTDYQRIAEYIVNNPQKWAEDSLNVRNNQHG